MSVLHTICEWVEDNLNPFATDDCSQCQEEIVEQTLDSVIKLSKCDIQRLTDIAKEHNIEHNSSDDKILLICKIIKSVV